MQYLQLEKINTTPISINSSKWSNGIYLLQIKLENRKLITKKLIVNRF